MKMQSRDSESLTEHQLFKPRGKELILPLKKFIQVEQKVGKAQFSL